MKLIFINNFFPTSLKIKLNEESTGPSGGRDKEAFPWSIFITIGQCFHPMKWNQNMEHEWDARLNRDRQYEHSIFGKSHLIYRKTLQTDHKSHGEALLVFS